MAEFERKGAFNCGVGRFLTVHPDGSVYPCHLLAFPEFCVGNVREKGLYAIYQMSGLMRRLRMLRFSEIAPCAGCFKDLSQEAGCLGTSARQRRFREELLNSLSEEADHK